MAMPKLRRFIMLAVAAGTAAAAMPAAAQYYWNDRPSYPRYYEQQQQPRDFFSFPFFGEHRYRPPVADYTKAPPPRKMETPPTSTVVVVGDSMADWLGHGLDEIYADQQPDTGVVREVRAAAGLIRYDSKNDTLDWPAVVKDELATQKPKAIIVMLGLNDRIPIRDGAPPAKGDDQGAQKKTAAQADAAAASPQNGADTTAHPVPGRSYEFHTDLWADLYVKRIDQMIAALKAKDVPVFWVGLPALRGTKSTSDMAYLDELYRERAERAGIYYVDIWDGFVDDQGRYAVDGPDYEGQTRRLRTADGVHFTKAGAVKLASYVDQELRRVLSSHAAPVALPEQAVPPKPAGAARPDVGPVLPLTVSGAEAGSAGGLAGAGNQAAPLASDPLAQKVMDRGAPLAAEAGRADDFAWPHPPAPTDLAPLPVSLAPAAPANGGAAHGAKTSADARKDAKGKPPADTAPAKNRRSPSASLDGAPRPPKDIGGGF